MINKRCIPWVLLGALGLAVLAAAGVAVVRHRQVRIARQSYVGDRALPALRELKAKNRELAAQLKRSAPQGVFIIIDTGRNLLTLKRGDKLLREGIVSTGSGNVLEDPNGRRSWVFDTPRGVFSVKAMIRDPYWVRPDWAFIEEGKPVPKRLDERVEGGVLGEYALSFGNGYFIHGTLYTRMLGRNVTHGCVRVGDADLEAVYRAASVGSKIIIF
jgi:lipoprotein-anchoring transpeptidase ErfK/SrfK